MKIAKKALTVILSVSLATSCLWMVPSSAKSVDNATIKSYEDQLAENREEQKKYQAELNSLSDQLSDALAYKTALDNSLSTTSEQKIILESMIVELEEQLLKLTEDEENLKVQIENKKQKFLDRMAAQQETGNASYLELILGATDMTTFLSNYDYVSSVLEYDQEIIASLLADKEALAKTKKELETTIEAKKSSITQLETEETYYKSLITKQETLINKINSDTALQQQMYNSLLAQEDEFEQSIQDAIKRHEELEKQQQPTVKPPILSPAPNVTNDGNFMWPLTTGVISSSFGGRRLANGDTSYHYATDIACPTGTPIYASNSGTVVSSAWHDSYGNYVLVDHGNGIATLYAHMSLRTCTAGQTVSKGDMIGQVGNTGYSFGSHLHFEYRINGQRVDPENYVSR